MHTAAAEPITTAGALDEQLSARLLQQRIIVLGAEVDDRIANRLCAELLLLSAEDPRSDISLYINSPGGSVSAGLAIYDTMRLIPNDVSTLAIGLAASMGQFLLCAGAAGKRFSLPHAQVLMHQGSAGFGGTAADIEIYAGQLERTGNTMIRLIAEHTGQPVERVEQDSLRDRWFSAEEARAYGIVDHIVERLDDVRPAAAGQPGGGGPMSQYTIPTVVEKTAGVERAYDIYSRLLSERIIFLGTEIDDGVANVIMAQLLHLEFASPDLEIGLYINSPGGSYSAMTAIYDTMQYIRPDVATICMGQASSAAAVLLAAGAPGKRAILRHAKVLLHQPSAQAQGTLPDLAVQAKEVARVRSDVEEILSQHTARPVAEIRLDTDRDKTFSAQEAVDYGLADQVITTRKGAPAELLSA